MISEQQFDILVATMDRFIARLLRLEQTMEETQSRYENQGNEILNEVEDLTEEINLLRQTIAQSNIGEF